jgi:hypothetical protein
MINSSGSQNYNEYYYYEPLFFLFLTLGVLLELIWSKPAGKFSNNSLQIYSEITRLKSRPDIDYTDSIPTS